MSNKKTFAYVLEAIKLNAGYRLDFLANDKVVLAIKSSDKIPPIHDAHILSYLRLSGCKIGLLMNFNVKLLKNGIKRFVNGSLD